MTEPKLYGIERADGSLDSNRTLESLDSYDGPDEFKKPGERVLKLVAVKKERLAALEEVVRAADRMRGESGAALDMTKEWHGGLCSCRKCKVRDGLGLSIDDYDSKRAALGEIGGEG